MNLLFKSFLEDDENVKKVFRRPFIFSLRPVLLWGIFWSALTFGLWFFYPRYNLEATASFDLNLLWQMSLFLGILFTSSPIAKWYVNAIIMTNESIIVVVWPKIFERRATRVDLHNLDEITTERIGWKSFFMNYGNVVINKVNGGEAVVVRGVSRPTKVARIIESYREYALDHKNFTEESALKGLLSQVVRRHVGDNGQPERAHRYDKYEKKVKPQREPEPEYVPTKKPVSASKPVRQSEGGVEFEKELDDTGGIDFDL